MSEKMHGQHLERKAILYVRQSSPYQVVHNLESQKLPYAMEARLQQLGWREIEVVDEDLRRSAARGAPAFCALTDKPHRVAVKEFIGAGIIEQDRPDASDL